MTAPTATPATPASEGSARTAQPAVVLAALAIIAGLAFLVGRQNGVWGGGSARPLVLFGIGLALGATLLGFDFGFAGAFRKAVVDRDLSGLRAHLSTFALAMAMIVPLVALGAGEGFSRSVGVTFLLGGGLFGVGMQLAGGCASGTLYQLGGGGQKHIGTLAGFVLGSVLAASHLERWWGLPALPPITLFTLGPWPLTLAIAITLVGAAFYALRGVEVPRRLLVGGALLAVLNAATVLASGHPWSETWAFTLWGSQAAAAVGVHPEHWRFFRDAAYDVSPFVDGTSIMDLAIPTGALLAAGVLGRFELKPASRSAWAAATLGGLAMGYGARMSGGCNIGSYFSTIASGDLSGWAWALAALGGSALGVRLRARIDPAFAPAA